MFHFISSYDLVETEVYHQKFSFTRKWEDCGGLSDCEELSGGYPQEMIEVEIMKIVYKG